MSDENYRLVMIRCALVSVKAMERKQNLTSAAMKLGRYPETMK